MSEPPARVPIEGMAEWIARQQQKERDRRAAFKAAIHRREAESLQATLKRERTIPPPLRCMACGDTLGPRDVGIETPEGALIHQRCRVGVLR